MKRIFISLLLTAFLTGCGTYHMRDGTVMKMSWAVQTGSSVKSKDMPVAATVAAAILMPTQSLECEVFDGKGSAVATGVYLRGHYYLHAVKKCKYY